MKNLTDFCKMVETGVDPRLKWALSENSTTNNFLSSI